MRGREEPWALFSEGRSDCAPLPPPQRPSASRRPLLLPARLSAAVYCPYTARVRPASASTFLSRPLAVPRAPQVPGASRRPLQAFQRSGRSLRAGVGPHSVRSSWPSVLRSCALSCSPSLRSSRRQHRRVLRSPPQLVFSRHDLLAYIGHAQPLSQASASLEGREDGS